MKRCLPIIISLQAWVAYAEPGASVSQGNLRGTTSPDPVPDGTGIEAMAVGTNEQTRTLQPFDCAASIKELWAIRHSDDVCYHMYGGYDAGKVIDCPLNANGIGISMQRGQATPLWKSTTADDLVLVSPMARTRETLYYSLLGAALLGKASMPQVRMDSALIEIGHDPGNIGTVTSEWSENSSAWSEPASWQGGERRIREWNLLLAQEGPKANSSQLLRWQGQTKNVLYGHDTSPQSVGNLARLHDNICGWVQKHPSSRVVLVSHHVIMTELLCLNSSQAGVFAEPFQVEDVHGFLHWLHSWPSDSEPQDSTCMQTFSR